jgi:aerobic C4-dicarboxylate transport protein
VVLGIAVGILAPEVGQAAQAARNRFVTLIKRICPVPSARSCSASGPSAGRAQIGKVGGMALLYFITMSPFAL